MIRFWAVLVVLLAARGAQARDIAVEAAGGIYWRDLSLGTGFSRTGTIGARVGVPVLRFDPLELRAELLFDHVPGITSGTTAAKVSTSFEDLALLARLGLPLEVGRTRVTPYLSGGPATAITSFSYSIKDPLGVGSTQSSTQLVWGAAYGLGTAVGFGDPAGVSFVGRIEGLRWQRGASADLLLQLGAGLLF